MVVSYYIIHVGCSHILSPGLVTCGTITLVTESGARWCRDCEGSVTCLDISPCDCKLCVSVTLCSATHIPTLRARILEPTVPIRVPGSRQRFHILLSRARTDLPPSHCEIQHKHHTHIRHPYFSNPHNSQAPKP